MPAALVLDKYVYTKACITSSRLSATVFVWGVFIS